MSAEDITVYVSDNCSYCRKVLALLDEWNVRFTIKNVSKHKPYMEELQNQDIYGTPVTYIRQDNQYILGLQVERLKKAIK